MRSLLHILRALIRLIGSLSLLLGLVAFGFLSMVMFSDMHLSELSLGQVWFQHDPLLDYLHTPSIQLVQVFFERKLQMPYLWSPGITTLLNWPTWLALSALSVAFLALGWLVLAVTRHRHRRT